ncbi:MAG: iron-containing alcohol dehydrogenase [Thermoanaerobaculia bacterium]|nr:iron-containing alcohol dehydrogenase [Thermoanaerobaculia bacterium]
MTEKEAARDFAALRQLCFFGDGQGSLLDDCRTTLAGIDVRFGLGRRRELGPLAKELGTRPLLVSDPGIRSAGHLDEVLDLLRAANLEPTVIDNVPENPTTSFVEQTATALADSAIDSILAVGGGSVLDSAKGINFILTQGGRMADYWGFGKATQPMLPAIAVPTTGGTGSEAQAYAVLADRTTQRKMACGDVKARYRRVVLDPELLATAPRRVVAGATLDAISHAVESLVSLSANATSRTLSVLAWSLLAPNFAGALDSDSKALGCCAMGAHLAGAAIEQSMLGAAHAAANPITARFGIRHGEAVGVMLPSVVRFNSKVAEDRFRELEGVESGEALADWIEEALVLGGLATHLRDLGVPPGAHAALAELATKEWTASFNPRPVNAAAFEEFYRAAL